MGISKHLLNILSGIIYKYTGIFKRNEHDNVTVTVGRP